MIGGQDAAAAPAPEENASATRSFYMGFTPFKHSWIDDKQAMTYDLIGKHADLILHHLDDGVPWVEALAGKPFHKNVEQNLNFRLRHIRQGQKVFVAATPIDFERKNMAGYWAEKESQDLPKAWRKKSFDDPDVMQAYLNYCRDLIRRFHPDYFSYGIEVNLLAYNNPEAYARFIKLAQFVYPALKREFPETPILLSFYLEPPARFDEAKVHIDPLLPYADIFAISTYPYMVREGPSQTVDQIPADWFTQVQRLAPNKPFAIAETGFLAEPLKAYGTKFPANAADQKKYVERLLRESDALEAEFVVWFVVADYDELWSVLKWVVLFNPLVKAWKDTGLFDGALEPRPALDVWDEWLRRPIRE